MKPHQFGQLFCTCDRAREAPFAFFLSTAERRLTRAIYGMLSRFFLFTFFRASINSFAFRKIMCKIFRFARSRPSIGATYSLAFRDPM